MFPPFTQLGKSIESAVRKALFDYSLLEEAEGISVALSGGKDSITLLIMLKAILGRGFPELPLHAIHVTGEFSCGAGVQESFIRKLCDELHVPLTVRESTQKRETLECYRCSRERRRLIFDAAKEVGATVVAFGHHEDDSIQTLLMNLLHKGEFAANLPKVPMHDYGVTIIRPLLYVSEKAITAFARLQGYARITCQCPVGQNSKRMDVKRLIDEMEHSFPNTRVNLAQAARNYGSTKALDK